MPEEEGRKMNEHSDCHVIEVIETHLTLRGKGIDGDPIRRVTQYWSLDGKLLFEIDPSPGTITIGDCKSYDST